MSNKEVRPVFVIEEDDETTDNAANQAPLLDDTADRAVGTMGFCMAAFALFACMICGGCRKELKESYNRHTLFGRWCPVKEDDSAAQ